MGNLIIKQPHNLTSARYKISVNSQRILFRVIEKLQPELIFSEDKDVAVNSNFFGDRIITVKTKSLLPSGSKNYHMVKNALKELRSITITIKSDANYEIYTGLINEARYHNNNSFVEIKIPSVMVPHFLKLAKGYTKYSLPIAFKLSSFYSMRIYMKLCHFHDKESMNIFLSEIREVLTLGNKYPDSTQFKNFVLLPAMRELKKKADVWFEIISGIKESRKIVGWKIKIIRKKKEKPVSKNLDIQNKNIEQKLVEVYGLSIRQAKKVSAKLDEKALGKELYKINLLKINGKIQNIGGYTAKVLSEKFNLKL